MKTQINTPAGPVSVGTRIRIRYMASPAPVSRAFPDGIDHQAEAYANKSGTVTCIDDLGQLHGTWGGLAIIPEVDTIEIIK